MSSDMPKVNQQKRCLPRKSSTRDMSLTAKHTARASLSRNKRRVRWKMKRKVGVTLISAVKKKQHVDGLLSEVFADATPKGQLDVLMHLDDDTSNRCNADNSADTTMSSCFSAIVIDSSSDAGCSSAADTTNVCDTSALSDTYNSEYIDYLAKEHGRITHGQG